MFSFNRQKKKVVFSKPTEKSRNIVAALEFVTALNQAQLVENRLNYLLPEDFPDLEKPYYKGDLYRKERNNYNSKYYYIGKLIALIKEIEDANPRGKISNILSRKGWDLVAQTLGPGDLDIFTVYNEEAYNSPERTIKFEQTPKEYGDIKEASFITDFAKTDIYHSIFKKHGYEIFPVEGNGVIFNYLGFGIDIYSEPDFGVVNTATGEVVGFIEYKARVATPLVYDNVFNVDVMQTALYSQFQGPTVDDATPRVWTIQNYSENKFIVSEYSKKNVNDVLDYIDSIYTKLVHDVYFMNVNVFSWESLYRIHGPESPQFWYTRNSMLRFITRDMKIRSAYKQGDGQGQNLLDNDMNDEDEKDKYYPQLPRLSPEELHRIYEYRDDGSIINKATGIPIILDTPDAVPKGYNLLRDGTVEPRDSSWEFKDFKNSRNSRNYPPDKSLARRFDRFIYPQRGRPHVPEPDDEEIKFFNIWHKKCENFIPTNAYKSL